MTIEILLSISSIKSSSFNLIKEHNNKSVAVDIIENETYTTK